MESFLSKHKWLVLCAGALIQLFAGIPAAWGVFQKAVEENYRLDSNAVSMVFSFTIAAFGIGCILGGILQDKSSPRVACIIGGVLLGGGFIAAALVPGEKALWLYLSFSLNVGLGCAFLYPAVMSCVQKWYADKKGLATGVVGGAVGLSGAVLTVTGRALISGVGIRRCFIVLGIVLLVLSCLGSVVMVNPKNAKPKTDSRKKSYTLPQMLKTPQYYIVFFAVALATPSVLLFSPTIVQFGIDRGLSENIALCSIAIGSVASAAGRIGFPLLSDKIGRKPTYIILFCALAVLSAIFIFTQKLWVIVVYSLLTLCYSGEAAVIPALSTDLYGFKHSGVNYGFLALGMSLGSVSFPLLAKAIGDNIMPRHIIAVCAAVLGAIILFFLKPTQGEKL